jgi:hypothetical protein
MRGVEGCAWRNEDVAWCEARRVGGDADVEFGREEVGVGFVAEMGEDLIHVHYGLV